MLQRVSALVTAKGNKSEDSLARTLKQSWENCGEKTLYSLFVLYIYVFNCPIFMFVLSLFPLWAP